MDNKCNICQSEQIKQLGIISLYSIEGDYETPVLMCKKCGVIYRDFDYSDDKIKNHFCIASYTDLNKEQYWKSKREGFFGQIVKLSFDYVELTKATNVLDFGCSYGHLLEEYKQFGCNCFGVELDNKLHKVIKPKFHNVYEDLKEISLDIKFDIINLIDSLYYVEDPVTLLNDLRHRLISKGIIIIRITNRAFLLKLLYKVSPSIVNSDIFGDGKYNFSEKSMGIMMEKAGFKVSRIIINEKGKIINGIKKKIIYNVSLLTSNFLRIKITPGLIYVVRKT